jgi:hypothetical protein
MRVAAQCAVSRNGFVGRIEQVFDAAIKLEPLPDRRRRAHGYERIAVKAHRTERAEITVAAVAGGANIGPQLQPRVRRPVEARVDIVLRAAEQGKARGAVGRVDQAVVGAEHQRVAGSCLQRELDSLRPRPRDIVVKAKRSRRICRKAEIDLVGRIPVKSGEAQRQRAADEPLLDPCVIALRRFGAQRLISVDREELKQRRGFEPFAIARAQDRAFADKPSSIGAQRCLGAIRSPEHSRWSGRLNNG